MIRVSVLYPYKDGAKFDHDYYANKHVPMVVGLLGSNHVEGGIDKGLCTAVPGDPPPFVCIGWLTFNTMGDFGAAFGPNADAIMADIPNYTDIEPQIQISEIQ